MPNLPQDYVERVYAGVLGKLIGVYLGRPFEGWSYERIMAELGEVWYYVHDRLGKPLVVTDDDIAGTFTFVRALEDYGYRRDLSPAQIGQSWLNYIIEGRTILWWGGLGNSTEHTAYLRLKRGCPAPASGSIALNSQVVAEQIGAQIFIDGWAMAAPGDPGLAADLARRAASVSHDGEAIYGAQMLAAMEAQAFVERDRARLLETGLACIPADSVIARLVNDIREWHARDGDWRRTRERIVERYGYDKYGGNCHMVPNHALIILGLLYGDDDFQKSLMIVNTCGWDTDCNSGNLGCLMGIKNGLAGIEDGPDWRGPFADRLYLSTADGGRAIGDAVGETYHIANAGRALAGLPRLAPKNGARYHFSLPGALQGFRVEESSECRGTLRLENVLRPAHVPAAAALDEAALDQGTLDMPGSAAAPLMEGTSGEGELDEVPHGEGAHSGRFHGALPHGTDPLAKGRPGERSRALALRYQHLAPGRCARAATNTFIPPEDAAMPGYGLMASPSLYPGQTVRLALAADATNHAPVAARVYLRAYGADDALERTYGPAAQLAPGADAELTWRVPGEGACPIAEIGVELQAALGARPGARPGAPMERSSGADGTLYLDYLTWDGAPEVTFGRPKAAPATGRMWQRGWVDGVDQMAWHSPEVFRLVQNEGTGLLSQGSRGWTDYRASAEMAIHLAQAAGMAVRVQGMRRYYALLLCDDDRARLVKALDGETVLAEAPFAIRQGELHELSLQAQGARLTAWVDGEELFAVDDNGLSPLDGGGIALLCREGRAGFGEVRVEPAG